MSEFEQWQSQLQSDPEAQLDLLCRLVRQKVAHTSFPSGDEHEGKWTRPAVDEFLRDLLKVEGPQLFLTVLERATSQEHVERALLIAIEHHLIDQAKATETGKLRPAYGNELRINHRHDRIDYLVPVDVLGRTEAVLILVQVWAQPPYCCYGLAPEDFPRGYGDRWRDSPHRHADDALCLYKPTDPPGRRWRSSEGLDTLLELVRLHLFYEDTWRLTRGPGAGIWTGTEAPHGFGNEAA